MQKILETWGELCQRVPMFLVVVEGGARHLFALAVAHRLAIAIIYLSSCCIQHVVLPTQNKRVVK